jgi:hypothetical protein
MVPAPGLRDTRLELESWRRANFGVEPWVNERVDDLSIIQRSRLFHARLVRGTSGCRARGRLHPDIFGDLTFLSYLFSLCMM